MGSINNSSICSFIGSREPSINTTNNISTKASSIYNSMASGSHSQSLSTKVAAGRYNTEEGLTKEKLVFMSVLQDELAPKLNLLDLSSFRKGKSQGNKTTYEFDGIFLYQNEASQEVSKFLDEVESSFRSKMDQKSKSSSVRKFIFESPTSDHIKKSDLILFEIKTRLTSDAFKTIKDQKPRKVAALYDLLKDQYGVKNVFMILLHNGEEPAVKKAQRFYQEIKANSNSKKKRYFNICGSVYFNTYDLWNGVMPGIANKKELIFEAYYELKRKLETTEKALKTIAITEESNEKLEEYKKAIEEQKQLNKEQKKINKEQIRINEKQEEEIEELKLTKEKLERRLSRKAKKIEKLQGSVDSLEERLSDLIEEIKELKKSSSSLQDKSKKIKKKDK